METRRRGRACALTRAQDYGSPDAFLPTLAPLLGQQAWQGESMSEGGFAPGKVSVANVLTTGSRSAGGKTYYQYEILTRTADGDEGGRHHWFAKTGDNGKLYILKCQAGDKRWFKGLECVARAPCAALHPPHAPLPRRDLKKVQASFTVV